MDEYMLQDKLEEDKLSDCKTTEINELGCLVFFRTKKENMVHLENNVSTITFLNRIYEIITSLPENDNFKQINKTTFVEDLLSKKYKVYKYAGTSDGTTYKIEEESTMVEIKIEIESYDGSKKTTKLLYPIEALRLLGIIKGV